MKQKLISGLIVPLITPMDDEFEVDSFSFKTHVARLMNKGVKNFFLLSSFAEQDSISSREEKELIRSTSSLVGKRANLIIGCVAKSTDEVIDKVLFAQRFSKTCVVNVPFSALTNEVLFIDFFDKLFTRTKADIILVNDPFYFKRNIPIIGLERIVNWEKLIGIIDYSASGAYYKALLDHYQSVKIFQGKEELLIASFENRSSGVVPILSNLIPTSFLDIEKEFDQVRNDVMLKKQAKLDLLLNKYFPTTKRVQSIKYALSIEGVIQKFFSEKLKDLTEQEESKIESFFEKILA